MEFCYFHFQEEDSRWKWKKPPPLSKKPIDTGKPEDGKKVRKAIRQAQNTSVREKLLKGLLFRMASSCWLLQGKKKIKK